MPKPLAHWPVAALLHLHKTLAYGLFFLGAVLGFVTIIPRVMELKGEAPDSLLVAGLIGAPVLLGLVFMFFIYRISREIERRLSGQ